MSVHINHGDYYKEKVSFTFETRTFKYDAIKTSHYDTALRNHKDTPKIYVIKTNH